MRGIALLGILIGNVMWFSGFAVADAQARAAFTMPAVDAVVETLVHIVVDGKFYSLFSLLLGAGFALGLRHGTPASFARRLAVLFVFGSAHATLLWFGDILSLYAVTGVVLLVVVDTSPRRLALAGVACLGAPIVLGGGWLAADELWGVVSGRGHGPASMLGAFASGSYADVFDANWAFLLDRWYLVVLSSRLLRILGMFLLGVAAIRADVLHRPEVLVRLATALWPFALVANVAVGLLGGDAPPRPPTLLGWLTDVLACVGGPTGAVVYAVAIVLGPRRRRIDACLGAAGRMSLTNYVGQSAVMAGLFYGYGLGGWGRLGASAAVLVAIVIFAAQVLISRAWLGRFDQGPLEWLWRLARSGLTRNRSPRRPRSRSPAPSAEPRARGEAHTARDRPRRRGDTPKARGATARRARGEPRDACRGSAGSSSCRSRWSGGATTR